jgi:hypothetical protein
MRVKMPPRTFFACVLPILIAVFVVCAANAQQVSAPEPQPATITGTVTDVRNDVVPGATVVLEGPASTEKRTVTTNENGGFQLDQVKPGIPYHIIVSNTGFTSWTSPVLTLTPGQYLELPAVKLELAVAVTTVTATLSTEEIATQQVEIAEQQRVLGFIPNFYVVYIPNPAPLTPKLKFKLALRVMTDPVTLLGSGFLATLDQAADTPDFGQGWAAFGQRWGAHYVNGFTDIMVGGALLPSILHQDPRYFYMGPEHTNKQRALHAMLNPFICKGDNGRTQVNYSSLGGYLASGAIANTYYPEQNRGVGLVFSTFATDIAADVANGLIQEFLLRKLTPSAKNQP